ncbi:hypothetical protein CB696_00070 [Salmonella enterica subsp. enterica serovar Livingstone]|nr:hypothetical protein [Salmonella enterica subsp. enterica serovar Livingstone]
MGYWLSSQVNEKVNGTKWHVYDIPNGWTPPRAGNVILRSSAWGNRWVDAHIYHEGDIVARKQHGENWGSTINAYVTAGSTVSFGVSGDGGAEWFKFMEF